MSAIVAMIQVGHDSVDPDLLRAMTHTLRHRGPDGEGYVLIERHSGKVACCAGEDSPEPIRRRYPHLSAHTSRHRFDIGLGHRRFANADETEGHQPLFDGGRNCCVVFHGAIYNRRDLREELLRLGHTFASSSDAEVILEAYKAWATACFQKFNGTWALLLSQPLDAPIAVNREAIEPFLRHGRRDLNDSTFFDNIHCFPPASWAVLDETFPDAIHHYWTLPRCRLSPQDISVGEAARNLKHVLQDAVRLRLPPNVPWCMELSGGLDTSILVAIAAQLSTTPIVTYTIRHPDQKSQVKDESPFAAAVATYHGTDHRVVDATLDTFWQDLPFFTYLLEEPYHAPNVYARQLMHRRMNQDGFKVVGSGGGGDELFAGYSGHFLPAQLENLAKRRWLEYVQNELLWPREAGLIKSLAKLLKRNIELFHDRLARKSRLQVLSDVLRCDVLNTGIPYNLVSQGLPYWVRTPDRARMGLPIEGLAPLCDYRVVELAFSLPTNYLIRGGWHKWILRQAFADILPEDVVWRRWKIGLQFPFQTCFSQVPSHIREVLTRVNEQYGDLSTLFPDSKPSFRFRQDDWGANTRLWREMSFLLWFECFINHRGDYAGMTS